MLRRLLPRRTEFFDLFSQQAALLVEGARTLRSLVRSLDDAKAQAARVRDVEDAIESCEDVANLFEDVVLENA
jgi:uncharacterized protein Yka (UPF0111/DUF47 family)